MTALRAARAAEGIPTREKRATVQALLGPYGKTDCHAGDAGHQLAMTALRAARAAEGIPTREKRATVQALLGPYGGRPRAVEGGKPDGGLSRSPDSRTIKKDPPLSDGSFRILFPVFYLPSRRWRYSSSVRPMR